MSIAKVSTDEQIRVCEFLDSAESCITIFKFFIESNENIRWIVHMARFYFKEDWDVR